MLRPAAALGFCALGLVVASPTATAQSWTRPPLVDADEAAEEHSDFWEEALSGGDEAFEVLMARAQALRSSRLPAQREAALPVLEQAAKLRPDKVEVHFAIGKHHAAHRDWPACTQALGRVFELEPGFSAIEGGSSGDLALTLGSCHLYSGNYEDAVAHLQRLITQDSAEQKSGLVHMRLGEALMALGRLEDATFYFQRATLRASNRSSNLQRQARYALAVAFDRAERINESKALLKKANRGDSQLTTLRSTDKSYAPASEEHFYLGLAYEGQHHYLQAVYHFRRFLSLDPASPWKMHAQSHLAHMPTPPLAVKLSVSGSAQWSVDALRQAIRKQTRSLSACVAGHPQVLATISLSAVLTKPPSRHQAKATISAQADVDRDDLSAVVECLESAARKIQMPKQSGLIGGHGNAQFSIIGAPSS